MAREKIAEKRNRALLVAERMNNYYGQAECALHYSSPFTLTIAVLLSAQTTDAGVNRKQLPVFLNAMALLKKWLKQIPKR